MPIGPAVFVPSKSRADLLVKTVPYWEKARAWVHLVVEEHEAQDYEAALSRLDPTWVRLCILPKSWQGIGYARHWIVQEASRLGLDVVTIVDDDIGIASNIQVLEDFVRIHPEIPGAASQFQDKFRRWAVRNQKGPILTNQNVIRQCISFNVERAVHLGWYSSHMGMLEDTDLLLSGMKAKQFPWVLHGDVESKHLARRHDPGGMLAVPTPLQDLELEAFRVLGERHGKEFFYLARRHATTTAAEGNTFHVKVNWRKVHEAFVPELPYSVLQKSTPLSQACP
jgi:hypothetical protein